MCNLTTELSISNIHLNKHLECEYRCRYLSSLLFIFSLHTTGSPHHSCLVNWFSNMWQDLLFISLSVPRKRLYCCVYSLFCSIKRKRLCMPVFLRLVLGRPSVTPRCAYICEKICPTFNFWKRICQSAAPLKVGATLTFHVPPRSSWLNKTKPWKCFGTITWHFHSAFLVNTAPLFVAELLKGKPQCI